VVTFWAHLREPCSYVVVKYRRFRNEGTKAQSWTSWSWRRERIEIGDAVDAKHHRLTVDHELLDPVLQRRLDNPREALGPIVAAARDQPHAVAVALQPQTVAVILDFEEPFRLSRDCRPTIDKQNS
jgi:hypothetical protein